MTIQEMQERKRELGYTYAQIADLSGLPLGTVQKVLGGITLTPRYETIMALERVLGEQPSTMRESAASYFVKKQGEYTLEDYYKIPDDIRVELIDGVSTICHPRPLHTRLSEDLYIAKCCSMYWTKKEHAFR